MCWLLGIPELVQQSLFWSIKAPDKSVLSTIHLISVYIFHANLSMSVRSVLELMAVIPTKSGAKKHASPWQCRSVGGLPFSGRKVPMVAAMGPVLMFVNPDPREGMNAVALHGRNHLGVEAVDQFQCIIREPTPGGLGLIDESSRISAPSMGAGCQGLLGSRGSRLTLMNVECQRKG